MLNSTFLDAFANQQATASQFATMALQSSVPSNLTAQEAVLASLFAVDGVAATVSPTPATGGTVLAPEPPPTITIALVLNRAHDPAALLESPWAERQDKLVDQASIWSKYGADPTSYATVKSELPAIFGNTSVPLDSANAAGYLSTQDDHTIWVTLNATQFQQLFGATLLTVTPSGGSPFHAWGGSLNLPDSIASYIGGLWVEEALRILSPTVQGDPSLVNPIPLTPLTPVNNNSGILGIGNGNLNKDSVADPAAVAANYNFPLSQDVQTGAIALIEANLPAATEQSLLQNYNAYRTSLGLPTLTSAEFRYHGMAGDQSDTSWQASGEFADDISVISGGAPTSSLDMYGYIVGSAPATPFNAYQRAFFDAKHADVLSSSYPVLGQPTADSPFQWAWQQLFVDGALKNISSHVSAGDQGSSGNISNGVANVPNSQAATMALVVGGTSIADRPTASQDATLTTLFNSALQGDAAVIASLVASGLKTLPANLNPQLDGQTLAAMFETVWQRDSLFATTVDGVDVLESSFGANSTGVGGVANGVPIPSYQSDFGVTSTGGFRGSPDVAALAGGDYRYSVLDPAATDGATMPDGGTSAATPLWASLTAQFNAIFADQGLPRLGFYNDLLYTAAVIAQGSFNDILLGNNINSFYTTTTSTTDPQYYNSDLDTFMVPTGQGYAAGPGYDLASGLGSPNGLLLARALTAIAQAQMHSTAHAVLENLGDLSGTSPKNQTLLVQDVLNSGSGSLVQVGSASATLTGGSALAWSSRLAGQSLQSDFDPSLVTLLDGAAQATIFSVTASAGTNLGVSVGGTQLPLYQGALSADYGFVQFGGADGHIDVARPVAIAQTVGGDPNQEAIVRIRQNGTDTLKLEIYRVDDLNGVIDGVAPGDPGYAAKAAARDYLTDAGATAIVGPGYGQFQQVQIKGVNPDDIVAMHLTDVTTGHSYWSFAAANESVAGSSVNHLWSYGLNTWGFEDGFGGGDHDFNDLVVQVDFTSAYGSAYIAGSVGGPGDDILANGAGGLSTGGSLTGNGGVDFFILRGDVIDGKAGQHLPVADLYPLATEITDMMVAASGKVTDSIGLSASSAAYTAADHHLAPYSPTGQGGLPVQPIGNAGDHAAANAAELIKLTTSVDTTGLTFQETFDTAIGNAKVTGLATDRSYFFTLYDQTNGNMVVGIVDDHNGSDSAVEAGDAISLIGIAPMSATDYSHISTNNFAILAA
jgi:hypothetical protein